MYQIKQFPEDFIVKEISNLKFQESGRFTICHLKKKNYTTQRAIEAIAKFLNYSSKDISCAGNKDKYAVTEQFISIKSMSKNRLPIHLKDINLSFVGFLDNPISMGMLDKNEFIITARSVSEQEKSYLKKHLQKEKIFMPNYFGIQRFSKNNAEIGKLLLRKNYKEAIEKLIEDSDYMEKMKDILEENKSNYIGALRQIPKKLLLFYIHAYQSLLWNELLKEYQKSHEINEKLALPIYGFGIEFPNGDIEQLYEKILEKENITERDFINRQIPELSSEGTERNAFVEIEDFKILEEKEDELTLSFKLNKGSYATVAIDFLFGYDNPIIS